MQSWQTFLQQQGAIGFDPATGNIANFGQSGPTESSGSPPATDFMTPLCDAGLIVASGADVATFLHNQLTNDVEHLTQDQARLAGYCTPKGRLLATFLIWRSGDHINLHLPRALQSTIRKRLQMFVLRAKAVLADAGDETVQLGLAGPAATAVLANWFPAMPAGPYATVQSDAGTLIRLADGADSLARYLWVSNADTLMSAWPRLLQTLEPTGSDAWRLARIRAGIPLITEATQEKFVPQMVNFELIGGVNFRKGCYPGQEIVARSQYLGKLKRRMMQASVEAAGITAGIEVFSSADPEQACGMIVEAAPTSAHSCACLVEVKLVALEASVHLGSAQGPQLIFGTLPYSLADSIQ